MFIFVGAYVPLTMEGDIMVDGVLASCYPSTDHDMAHIAMAPMRWYPQIAEIIFGEYNGYSNYLDLAIEFAKWTYI